MNWHGKRYNNLNYFLRSKFGEKTFKLSLDGGFTCPNRDGTLDTRGCIFCSEEGSGEFAGKRKESIQIQMSQQIDLMKDKWQSESYIAYFQNYTNTYGHINDLETLYNEPLKNPFVKGIAIGTRPDCLSDEVIDLLGQLSKKTYVWVELGLQSIHGASIDLIRRHYDNALVEEKVGKLQANHVDVVLHLILGLPNESMEDFLETIEYVNALKPTGVKFHMLNILKRTDLADYYQRHPFEVLSMESYVTWVCEGIKHLSPEIVIHRMTGDGRHEDVIAPNWIKDKRRVLNNIDKKLKEEHAHQGIKYQPTL